MHLYQEWQCSCLVLIPDVCTVECKTARMCKVSIMAQYKKKKVWPKTLLDSPLPRGEHSIIWTHQRSSPPSEWCLYSRIGPECCATFFCPSHPSHDPHSYTRLSGNAGRRTAHPTANREKQLTPRIQYTNRNRNFDLWKKKLYFFILWSMMTITYISSFLLNSVFFFKLFIFIGMCLTRYMYIKYRQYV